MKLSAGKRRRGRRSLKVDVARRAEGGCEQWLASQLVSRVPQCKSEATSLSSALTTKRERNAGVKGEGLGEMKETRPESARRGTAHGYVPCSTASGLFFFFFCASITRHSVLASGNDVHRLVNAGEAYTNDTKMGPHSGSSVAEPPIAAAQVPCSALTRPAKNFGTGP